MKKISIVLCAFFGLFIASCDNLPDEQFVKRVVFTQNGFVDRVIDYTDTGIDTTHVSISVSGTSVLEQDIVVGYSVDADTLAGYNFERFRDKTALYYSMLPEDCYDFLDETVTIKSGDEYATLPIQINMDKINKYVNYVLPLKITSVSSCEPGLKNYATILMNILLKNSFSGTYNVSGKVYDKSDNSELDMAGTKKTLRVVNDKTCYLYVGNVDDANVNKSKYIVEVTINEDNTLSYRPLNPDIEFEAETSNVENKINMVELTISKGSSGSKGDQLTTKLNMQYKYKDITDPTIKIEREFKGALVMNTTINTH